MQDYFTHNNGGISFKVTVNGMAVSVKRVIDIDSNYVPVYENDYCYSRAHFYLLSVIQMSHIHMRSTKIIDIIF